jgi:hypothetical protein
MRGRQVEFQDVQRSFEGRMQGEVGDFFAQRRGSDGLVRGRAESCHGWQQRWIHAASGEQGSIELGKGGGGVACIVTTAAGAE